MRGNKEWAFGTKVIALLCFLLFIWNQVEKRKEPQGAFFLTGMTPLLQEGLFDYPDLFKKLDQLADSYDIHTMGELDKARYLVKLEFAKIEREPLWKGLYEGLLDWFAKGRLELEGPLCQRIKEGELWRLFSPSFLHKDFLHLLFNLSWFIILGRLLEKRIGWIRFILCVLLLSAFSNGAQYLMSGLYFLGLSGVVVGLAGILWSGQRDSLSEGTFLSIFYFVVGMAAFGVVTFLLKVVIGKDFGIPIANTAHLAGGAIGLLLGRSGVFMKRKR